MLANHSYLDLSLVGSDNADGVQCHTDLAIMFAVVLKVSIVETGSYFSNGNRQQLAGDIYPFGEARTAQRVVIRHTSMVRDKLVSITVVFQCTIILTSQLESLNWEWRYPVELTFQRQLLQWFFLFHRTCANIWRYNSYCAL